MAVATVAETAAHAETINAKHLRVNDRETRLTMELGRAGFEPAKA
jgi:hypothetical protein